MVSNLAVGKRYTKYKTATGEITGEFGTSDPNQPFSNSVGDDESYIEGSYDTAIFKISDGKAVSIGVAKRREQAIAEMKSERVAKLLESDWTQGADSPLSSSKKTEWATYRQALRDLPTTHAKILTIDNVVWPEEPS